MKKLLNISLCFILTLNFGYSQSIKRNVISSFGASSNTANSIVETTFGQPPNIGTISDGNNYVRQGFQQPLYNFIFTPGCTDSLALNYDANALIDDGSCLYNVSGCTDSTALNYNPLATIDDTSCIATVFGCIDSLALNYYPIANADDNTCYYCSININAYPIINPSSPTACDGAIILNTTTGTGPYTYIWSNSNTSAFNQALCNEVYSYMVTDANGCGFSDTIILSNYVGCMDSTALNYDPNAIVDDETCVPIIGCTDPTAFNYNSSATSDDGSCIAVIQGCIDTMAVNYLGSANTDDGGCIYCDIIISNINIGGNLSSCSAYILVTSSSSYGPLTYSWSNGNTSPYNANLCVGYYILNITDTLGCTLDTTIEAGTVVMGCTDSIACNYDSLATVDDGSCVYPTTSTTTVIACDSLVWNEATYDSSGIYYYNTSFDPVYTSLVNNNPYSSDSLSYWLNYMLNIYPTGTNIYNNENYQVLWGRYFEDFSDNLAQGWSWSGTYWYNGAQNVIPSINGSFNFTNGQTAYSPLQLLSPIFTAPTGYEITSISLSATVFANGGTVSNSGVPSIYGINVKFNSASWVAWTGIIPQGTTSCQMSLYADGGWHSNIHIQSLEVLSSNSVNNLPFTPIAIVVDNCVDSMAILDLTINQSGCTDSLTINYDPLATCDDSSCIPFLLGCTDSLSINYNPLANTDDGTCVATILGCTDSTQFNYDSLANTNSGCIPFIYGCLDSISCNYDLPANVDDGSCVYPTTSTTTVIACDSLVWNEATYDSSGIYYYNTSFDPVYTSLVNNNPYSSDSLSYWLNYMLNIYPTGTNIYNNENYQQTWGRYYEDFSDNQAQGWSWSGCSCWNWSYGCCASLTATPSFSNGDLNIGFGNSSGGFRNVALLSPIFNAPTGHEITSLNFNSQIVGGSGTPVPYANANWGTTQIQTNTSGGWITWSGSIPLGSTSIQLKFDAANTGFVQIVVDNIEVLTSNYTYNLPFTPIAIVVDNCVDSMTILNLTINNPTSSYLSVSECEDYTWSVNNVTYSTSGLYIDSSLNADGCTQVDSLDLAIYNATTSIDTQSACDSYAWIDGNTYTTSNNSATYTILGGNLNGCDSIITLNLTLNQTDTSYTNITACDSVEWNGIIYNISGTYSYSSGGSNNYSMSFDGVDDYLFLPQNGVSIMNNISSTVSFWFKMPNPVQHPYDMVFLTNHWQALNTENILVVGLWGSATPSNEGKIYGHLRDSNNGVNTHITSSMRIDDGGWHHYAIVLDKNQSLALQYIDGVLDQTYSLPSNFNFDKGQGWKCSGDYGYANYFIENYTDEIQFSNYNLSQSEIQQYMNCPPSGSESGLVGYWNFEEGTGTTALDLSGNGNNGTINGAAYDTNVPYQSCGLTNANGCDSTAILNLTINNPTSSYLSVVECEDYIWSVNNVTYSTSGLYIDSSLNAVGCNQIDSLDLTIYNATTSIDTQSACDSYAWIDGNTYTTSNNSANYTIAGGNLNGCDSIITLNLTINQTDTSYTNITACDSVAWNGTIYNISGTYSSNIGGSNNYSMIFDSNNDNISISNPNNYSFGTGDFTISLWYKSNSITGDVRHLARNIGAAMYYELSASNDANSNISSFGIHDGTTYYETFESNINIDDNEWHYMTGVRKSDSIFYYIDGILQSGISIPSGVDFDNLNDMTVGGKYYGGGNGPVEHMLDNYSVWDIALGQQEIQNYMNCPPTGTESGLVGYWNFEQGSGTTAYDQTSNIHNGTINGATYDANVPMQSCGLINTTGCDSTAVLNLTINQADTSYTNITACDSVVWNGISYDSSGTYYHYVNNSLSLLFNDSLLIDQFTMTVNSYFSHTLPLFDSTKTYRIFADGRYGYADGWSHNDACYSYAWDTINGIKVNCNGSQHAQKNITWLYDGVYDFQRPDNDLHNNCCFCNGNEKTYFWTIAGDNNTHLLEWIDGGGYGDNSGSLNFYVYEMQNPVNQFTTTNGCDSTATLNLTINPSTTSSVSVVECEDYIWSVNNVTYSTSGLYIDSSLNADGCIQLDSLDLTIYNATTSIDVQSACDSYTWIDGNTYIASNSFATYTLAGGNLYGCDSIITLNLTINQTDTSYTNITTCDSVVWNGTTYGQSGTHSYTEDLNYYSLPFEGIRAVEIDPNFNFNSNLGLTVTMWVKNDWTIYNPSSGNLNECLFSLEIDNNSYVIQAGLDDNGILCADVCNYNIANQNQFDNQWIHLAFTYTVNSRNFYINGQEVASDYTNNPIFSNILKSYGDNFMIGQRFTGAYYFGGLIDNFKLYGKGLSSQEIIDDMSCISNHPLIAYWDFEEGIGNLIYDNINNISGNIVNSSSWTNDVPSQSCSLTNSNGCDSTAILNLTINQADTSYTSITSCDSVVWNGTTYTQSGTFSSNIGSNNNYSMSFDGNDDNVEITEITDYELNHHTLSLWYYSSNVTAGDLFSKDGESIDRQWLLQIATQSDRVQTHVWTTTGLKTFFSNAYLSDNTWYHLAQVWDGDSLKLYINGILDSYILTTGTLVSGGEPLRIGGGSFSSDPFYYDGILDDVCIWNTALSSLDINQYMNCPPTGNESGLVGYWNFEEGTGTTAYDQTPNGNNGTNGRANERLLY